MIESATVTRPSPDPAASSPPAGPRAHPEPVEQPTNRSSPRNPAILVAEDDDSVREALCRLLPELGFKVAGQAADGAEAVEESARLHPDLVLMDLRMPVMDGIEATRMIKNSNHKIQVLILSAYDDPSLRDAADEVGAYCYLVKGCGAGLMRDVLMQAWRTKLETS